MATELDRLIVRIEADAARLKSGLADAERATNRAGRRMSDGFSQADRAIGRTIASIGSLRNVLLGLGAIQVGRSIIGNFAAFEKGLIGVGKTTNLAGAELADLGRDIQDLAQRVPEATTTLLEIAKSAGQLGVQGRANIVKFTEVIGKLGGATDLSGEAAASTLARLLNITNTGVGDIDRLGAAIVDLGNNFAATEAEIADVALRVARGTAPFRVSLADTLAIATALRAVGVEAEAGGSVILRAFQQINKGLEQGGDELAALVAITGRSVEELKEQFGRDATGAFLQFIEASGEIATNKLPAFLELLGLDGVRAAGVLQALAGRSDELRRALEVSNRAWKENAALTTEADRALEGLSAQWQLTQNAVDELGTAIGAILAPSIKDLLGDLRSLAGTLTDVVTELDAFFDRIASSPIGRFVSELNKLDPTRLAFEALTRAEPEPFPAEGITIPLPPPLPTSRQGTRNAALPGGGDKTAENARKQIEASIRALEIEAQVASTVASQREELAAILALENAAREANIVLSDEQIARVKAAIGIVQQQTREEERLAKVQAAETQIGEDIEELKLRLQFAGRETEEFRVKLRLLELRRDLEGQITPEMEAQVRQAEQLRSLEESLAHIRATNVNVTDQLTSATFDLENAAGQFGQTITSALEDAIVDGARLSDILRGLETDARRLLTRIVVLEPIERGLRTGIGAFQTQGQGGPGGLEGLIGGGLQSFADLFPSPVAGVGLGAFNRIDPLARQDVGSTELEAIFGSLSSVGEEASTALAGLEVATGAAGGSLEGSLAPAAVRAATETLSETAATTTAATALANLTAAATSAAAALATVAASSTASSAGTAFNALSVLGPGPHAAHGGRISGPGGSMADRIPAMLSDGEFVVRADMARKHANLLEAINSGRLQNLRRFAEGGFVLPTLPDRRPTASAAPPSETMGLRPIIMHFHGVSDLREVRRNAPQWRGQMREMIDRAEKRDS